MDRHTLFYIQGGLLLFLSVVLYGVFRQRRRTRKDRSADWAAVAFALAGTGLVLQSYRGIAPDVLSIILGNFLFMLFGPCFSRSVAQATGARQDHFRLLTALTFATIGNFWFYTYAHPNVMLRTLEAFGVMAVQYAAIISVLLKSHDGVVRPALRAMVGFFAMHILLGFLRFTFVLVRWNADTLFSWTGVITITGLALSFLWIEGLRMSDELEANASTDPLTGLLNRRGLEMMAARGLDHADRKAYACSAMALDINHFKAVNDTWGHAAGDQALCAVAVTLRATLRNGDILARLGGDEFFVLMPDCEEDAAQRAARRLRAAVEQMDLTTFYGQTFRIAVSIGVTCGKGAKMTLADLMHASDILLYQDKRRQASGKRVLTMPYREALEESMPGGSTADALWRRDAYTERGVVA